MRDTRDDRLPLRASELPPNQVMLYPGLRAVVCPRCRRWQVPYHGRLRRHGRCPEAGRRVWFDLPVAEWLASLGVAAREAASRRGTRVHRTAVPPIPAPLHRAGHQRPGSRQGW